MQKSKYFFSKVALLITVFTGSFFTLYAQAIPICNPGENMAQNQCTISNFKGFAYKVAMTIIFIVLIFAFPIRLALALAGDFQASQGGTAFRTKLKQRVPQIVLGFVLLLLAFYSSTILSSVNVDKGLLQFNLFSLIPVEHAYAQGVSVKPIIPGSPIDILVLLVQVLWKWFVFPFVIFAWFYTGFRYVAAQGAPEKIKEAHSVLTGVVILTGVLLFIQGFLFAAKSAFPAF